MTETPSDRMLFGERIAEGRVAEIYAWGENRIVKLARDWVPDDWVDYELKISRIVHAAGLDVPEPFEEIRLDGRTGIIYSRVEGPTMLDRLATAPLKAGAYGRMLGQLHAEMHAKSGAPDLPDGGDRLHGKIDSVEGAPEVFKQTALEMFSALPRGAALLHGDFHPGNVILAPSGPVIIDWPDAARGHPLADVARSVVLISLGGLPSNPVLRLLVAALRTAFRSRYLGAYFKRTPFRRPELKPWLFPVLFARLSEGIESEREHTRRWLRRLRPDLEP
jgi:aminoglycoside phosphotransferase (APT) family kinase protein